MGNKSTKIAVAEKYTRPQGLYDCKDLDYRKLRRHILNGQLAPCFPGADECSYELDKCPICFLFYPSLNRSRCCSNAICTECYLQIKATDSARSVRCPYCKRPSYMVEFRGAKTAEEKSVEQAEEQKVIEAKIRKRQRELREEAERVKKVAEDTQAEPFGHEGSYMSMERGMFAHAAQMQLPLPGLNRTEQFDLDDEDMMLMEAAAYSSQEQGPPRDGLNLAQHIRAELREGDRIANRGLEIGKNPTNERRGLAIRVDPSCRGTRANGHFSQNEKQDVICGNWQSGERRWWNEEQNGWSDNDSEANSSWSSTQRVGRDSALDLVRRSSSEVVEAGTSFSGGLTPSAPELWEAPDDVRLSQSSDDSAGEMRLSSASGSRLPLLTFDEQIMVAMVLSLADA